MVFGVAHISCIWWWTVSLSEELQVLRENHKLSESHRKALLHTYTCMEYTSTRTENELITVRHLLNMYMYIQLPYDRGHDCPFQHLHYIYEIWSCFIHSMYKTCGKNTDIYCKLLINFDGLFENACPLNRHIIYNI